ncbi:MAG: disulfide bond formation protein B [Patescibacteria group bacterium]
MQSFISFVNIFWSSLTVVADLLVVVLVIAVFSPKLNQTNFVRFFERKSLLIAFLVSFLAALGSLIYSDVIGYDPCKLCWFQRIFMYPQVILFGIAAFRRDAGMKIYGIALSGIGAVIALFHYIGQIGWNPFGLECLAIGYSVSCAKNFVLQFGYVTIPMMALSAFVLILVTLCIGRRAPSDDISKAIAQNKKCSSQT